MTKLSAAAIDLGHGHTKYSCSLDGVTHYLEFPSVAVPVISSDFEAKGSQVSRARALTVEANGKLYLVGPDAPSLQTHVGGRLLDPSFSQGDGYKALMKVALAHMGKPFIGVLSLGLPLTTFRLYGAHLRQAWSGAIEVPDPENPGLTKWVEIRQVLVLPQPIGALAAASQDGAIVPSRGHTLIVDVGYFTCDWVLTTSDKTILHSRSGALQGGIAAVVRQLTAGLEREVRRPIQNTAMIELALREGGSVQLFGKEYPLAMFRDQTDATVDAMVAEMVYRLGDCSDIRQVLVAGGGGHLFQGAISRKLGMPAYVLPDPQFANVRGFHAMAESLAIRDVEAAA